MKGIIRISAAVAVLAAVFVIAYPRIVRGGTSPISCLYGCVLTHGYDDARDNVNSSETIFDATNFPASFTNQSISNLNGIIYAQPLFVSELAIAPPEVLIVATEENWIYALDANNLSNSVPPRWSANLNLSGETAIPDSQLPGWCADIAPEVGITGTPVIDNDSNSTFGGVIYAVSAHYNGTTSTQRLNALNVATGSVEATALDIPTAYSNLSLPFYPTVQNQRAALALAHDAGGNPLIYVSWAAHCDNAPDYYTGKTAVFTLNNTTTASCTVAPCLSLVATFDDEPNGFGGSPSESQGGIWMGGSGPAIDDTTTDSNSADAYFSTGNGTVSNPYITGITGSALGQSVLRLNTAATDSGGNYTYVASPTGAFTTGDYNILNCGSWTNNTAFPCSGTGSKCANLLQLPPPYTSGDYYCSMEDMDVDSGGIILALATGGVLPTGDNFVVLAGGKEGVVYDLDPSKMNNTMPDPNPCPTASYAIQCFGAIRLQNKNINTAQQTDAVGSRCGPAFWAGNSSFNENILYVAGSGDTKMWAYQMTTGASFTTSPALGSYSFGTQLPYPGACPEVSWNQNGTVNPDKKAVLWVLTTGGWSTNSPVGLYAFQALPNSSNQLVALSLADTMHGPGAIKFSEPTVVNGHVYVAGYNYSTISSCTSQYSGGVCYGSVVSWHP